MFLWWFAFLGRPVQCVHRACATAEFFVTLSDLRFHFFIAILQIARTVTLIFRYYISMLLSDPFLVQRSVQSECKAIDCCSSCRCEDIASADGTLTDCSIAWETHKTCCAAGIGS